MNAACPMAKTIDDVRQLSKTPTAIILVGSITIHSREGNPLPRWYDGQYYTLNSFGLPNAGLAAYTKWLPKMKEMAAITHKPLAVSIAGFHPAEFATLAQQVQAAGADMIELNFGCPNVLAHQHKQDTILSFDIEGMAETIKLVQQATTLPLMVKLSPYSNPMQLAQVAKMLSDIGAIAAVVCSNSFPNGVMTNNAKPVLASQYGGVGGKVMLPIGLGQVRQFRQLLSEEIAVVGVGGIESKDDVEQYLSCGANMVQTASLIVRHGHAAIASLVK